jgi:hypothetical protein
MMEKPLSGGARQGESGRNGDFFLVFIRSMNGRNVVVSLRIRGAICALAASGIRMG